MSKKIRYYRIEVSEGNGRWLPFDERDYTLSQANAMLFSLASHAFYQFRKVYIGTREVCKVSLDAPLSR